MDAKQALADLTEISSQIQAAVVFDDQGKVAASTLGDSPRADELARAAGGLLAAADEIKTRRERADAARGGDRRGQRLRRAGRKDGHRGHDRQQPDRRACLLRPQVGPAHRQAGREAAAAKKPAAARKKTATAAKKKTAARKPATRKKPDAS